MIEGCSKERRSTCAERHCFVCGVWHLEPTELQTCVQCIGATAALIRQVVVNVGLLPEQAIEGQNGDPHRELHVPGGDALVMLLGGSEHVTGRRSRWGDDQGPCAYSYPSDPNPPLNMLATWEDDWRHTLDLDVAGPATYASTSSFLLDNLGWAAQQHPAFDEFAEEIRKAEAALEAVLHAGIRDETGVPCMYCSDPPRLRQTYDDPKPGRSDQGGRRDLWTCPKCHQVYTPGQYAQAEAAAWAAKRAEDPFVPIAHAADLIERPLKTVRTWVDGDRVRSQRDDKGRLEVHWDDVRELSEAAGRRVRGVAV